MGVDLQSLSDRFATHLRDERRYSPLTVTGYAEDLRACFSFVEIQVGRPPRLGDLSRDRLQGWIASLADKDPRTVQRRVAGVRALLRYAADVLDLCKDFGKGLVLPKLPPRKLPPIPNEEETARLVEAPTRLSGRSEPTLRDVRDRAYLEITYAGGLRISEVVGPSGLTLSRVHLRADYTILHVIGKGQKERLVPIKGEAHTALRAYLRRRAEHPGASEQALFLTWAGTPLSRRGAHQIVRFWAKRAGVRCWPHLLRHACATHLLARGAELRRVQEFLGHSDPATTAHYAQVDESQLLDVADLHPRARGGVVVVQEDEGDPTPVGLVNRATAAAQAVAQAVRQVVGVCRYARRLLGRALRPGERLLDPAPSPS